jgi:membrane protease YdiL (CAAX protease family)
MDRKNLLELAKQGNPDAIATLINRSLNSQGIRATAKFGNECLYILLESEQVPQRTPLVAFIRNRMMDLHSQSITSVKVYGRQLGTNSPAWKQKIDLRHHITSPSKIADSQPTDRKKPQIKSIQDVVFEQPNNADNPFLKITIRSIFIGAILSGIFISIGMGLVMGIAEYFSHATLEPTLISPILYILIFSWLCLWLLQRLKKININPRYIFGNLASNYKWFPNISLVIPILLFSLGSFYISAYFLSFINPESVESILNERLLNFASNSSTVFISNSLQIFTVVIVAPIVEEFLFRGIILHRWAAKWGIKIALLLSSFVFGLLHDNVVGLSMFGLMMGLLYIKTRTLIVPIVCHALNNTAVVILEFLLIHFDTTKTVYTVEQFRSLWWLGVAYVMLSAPTLIYFIAKNWPNSRSIVPYLANAHK